MIPSPMLILAVVVAFVVNGFFWYAKGSNSENARWTAKITAERLAATEQARVTEAKYQGAVNEATKKYKVALDRSRADLRTALDSLRDRPERPLDLPGHPRPDCAGGTGAELSRPDAEFLAGEAARADDVRAGLGACYAVIDAVKSPPEK